MSLADTAHEFGALNTLLLVVMLTLCVISAYVVKNNSLYWVPESSVAILVGMFVGLMAKMVYPSSEELEFLKFKPEIFFFLLLPIIIFEAGYSLKSYDFFKNFLTILLFAVIGTIISTITMGFMIYSLTLLGIKGLGIKRLSSAESFMFASLMSSIDPVATLSIMGNKELNCNKLLYTLVFGESVLNDAISILLFKLFSNLHQNWADLNVSLNHINSGGEFSEINENGEEIDENSLSNTNSVFSFSIYIYLLYDFVIVSFFSLLIGIITGFLCTYLFKTTSLYKYVEYEISLLILFAYGSYAFAESVDMSGIISLFFCGVVLSRYNVSNLNKESQITSHNFFKSLTIMSEFFVFLYIGMGVFTSQFHQINMMFVFICCIICWISRVFNIFPLSFIANYFRDEKISLNMQFVMWFSGLRGAICYALVRTFNLFFIIIKLYLILFLFL